MTAAGSVLAVVAGTSAVGVAASAAPVVHASRYAPLTRAMAAQLSKNVNQHVIVILKRQFASAHVGSRAARVNLTNDANDPVGAYLIDPDGNVGGYGQNGINGTQGTSLTAYAANPIPGVWTLIVDFAEPVVGDEISQPYTGNVVFNNVHVHATGLPNSANTQLAAGAPVTIPVTITNNGNQAEDFFLDPRLNSATSFTLAPFSQASGLALPLVVGSPVWFMPTESTSVSVSATASLPIMFDYGPNQGDPDLVSSTGTSPTGSYTTPAGKLTDGFWFATPSEIGPYPSGAPAGTVSMSISVTTKAFDTSVSSDTGDLELAATNPATTFSPVVINPGQSATVNITITPSGGSGTLLSGTLYVDDFMTNVPPYASRVPTSSSVSCTPTRSSSPVS